MSKIYDDLLKFDKNDLINSQPNYFWEPNSNEGIKHYVKGFYNENKPLKKIVCLEQKNEDKFLDIIFYQREEDVEKPYILGKDEYYVEVILSSLIDEEDRKDDNKFYTDDIIIKKIKSMGDIYNITNLCEDFSYELGTDIFKTLSLSNDTYGDGESNLVSRMVDVLNERKDSGVGNEFLSESITFLTCNGLSFIYHEDDIKS